jgi:hypothetical protein
MVRIISIFFLTLFLVPVFSQKPEADSKKSIRQWGLSSDFTEEVPVQFDTLFSLFQRYRISDRYSPFNASMGNHGLPLYQINFFDRITDPDMFLYNYYYPFMYLPDKAQFMNTQIPFTELIWTFGAPRERSEQTLRVRHSQNVNRYLNFGLVYDIIYSLGQYNYQRAEDKNFTVFSSYNGPKYKFYFSAGINNLLSYENGGITAADQLALFETRDIPVNLGGLNKATSNLKNRNLLVVQRYTLGKQLVANDTVPQLKKGFFGLSGTFSHILILESNKRSYSDGYPESGFYDTIFINRTATFDSLYSGNIKNTLRFDFTTDEARKFRLGGGAGLRNEFFRYSQIIPTHDTLLSDTLKWNRSNNAVIGRLYNNIGDKFRWSAEGELYLTGYRTGDLNLKGEITKTFEWEKGKASWIISGGVASRQPSFWFQYWGSNHFEWHNNFNKEVRIDIGTAFSYPARRIKIRFNYALIDNYTDFNKSAVPSQHTGGLSVVSVLARKELSVWKFHIDAEALFQKSSNFEILDLPFVTARSALYFEHLFRFEETNGKLNTQLGADITYHTPYYSYSYMPATGRFFRQDKVKTGNYPFINVFLNIKLQRTRFFIMMDHLNAGMMGMEYFMMPLYPMNIRMLRYGLAWTFYN